MKNKILLFALIIAIFLPFIKVNAEATDLATTIEYEYSLIQGNDQYADLAKKFKAFDADEYYKNRAKAKVTVYVFRGSTCSHCLDAMAYFAGMYSKFSDKIDIITYETWEDKDNAQIFEKVAKGLGTEASGVPFIVIGDKFFSGYSSEYNKQIEDAINSAYADENYKDKVASFLNGEEEKAPSDTGIVIAIFAVVILGGAALVYFSRKK